MSQGFRKTKFFRIKVVVNSECVKKWFYIEIIGKSQFSTVFSIFDPFKFVFTQNYQRKVVFLDVGYIWEKNFRRVTSHFRRMTSFLAQNDVFWPILTKTISFHPLKVVLRLNCSTPPLKCEILLMRSWNLVGMLS